MPVDPVPGLISRRTPEDVQGVLDKLADSLDDVVNFGTRVIDWYSSKPQESDDVAIPLLMLLRHMLALIDATSVLVRSSAIEPATVLLRSVFETKVYLAWLLKEDTQRRALGFLVCFVQKQLKSASRLDPRTQQAKQLAKELEGTAGEGLVTEVDIAGFDFDAIRKSRESALNLPHFQEAVREFEEAKAKYTPKGRKDPPWYFLFGGKRNLEVLAAAVGMSDWYHLQYREWSDDAHASNIIQNKVTAEEGKASIVQMRSPIGVENIYFYSVTAATKAYLLVLEKYAPDKTEELRRWYSAEVQPLVTRTATGPIIKAVDSPM